MSQGGYKADGTIYFVIMSEAKDLNRSDEILRRAQNDISRTPKYLPIIPLYSIPTRVLETIQMDWFADAFAFLAKGGPVMIPLMACSVASLAVIIERYTKLKAASADTGELMRSTEDLVYAGQIDKAIAQCDANSTPVAAVISAGLKFRRGGIDHAQRAMEEQAIRESGALQRRLSVLDTIITIAPLLGLLGTVTGMIRSFHVISSKQGMSAPTAITGGVAEALIATATGLAIAIVTLVAYNYLNERVKHCVEEMEIRGTQMTNVLADIQECRNEVKTISA